MAFKPSGIRVQSIVGRVVAPAESKFDGALYELRLAVAHRQKNRDTGEYEDKSTSWLTYKANNEYGKALAEFGQGDLVEITDAALETREYAKRDGNTGLAVDVRFGEIALLEKKGEKATASAESPW